MAPHKKTGARSSHPPKRSRGIDSRRDPTSPITPPLPAKGWHSRPSLPLSMGLSAACLTLRSVLRSPGRFLPRTATNKRLPPALHGAPASGRGRAAWVDPMPASCRPRLAQHPDPSDLLRLKARDRLRLAPFPRQTQAPQGGPREEEPNHAEMSKLLGHEKWPVKAGALRARARRWTAVDPLHPATPGHRRSTYPTMTP